ncbi:hypothetical protein O181_082566, partial [Austropuccinia psidii MF-1]|nr:hypothetical protein [Austropuccinia psidii MF-1]
EEEELASKAYEDFVAAFDGTDRGSSSRARNTGSSGAYRKSIQGPAFVRAGGVPRVVPRLDSPSEDPPSASAQHLTSSQPIGSIPKTAPATAITTAKRLKAGKSFLEELKRKDAEREGRLAAKASKDRCGMSITALADLETAPYLSGGSRDTGEDLIIEQIETDKDDDKTPDEVKDLNQSKKTRRKSFNISVNGEEKKVIPIHDSQIALGRWEASNYIGPCCWLSRVNRLGKVITSKQKSLITSSITNHDLFPVKLQRPCGTSPDLVKESEDLTLSAPMPGSINQSPHPSSPINEVGESEVVGIKNQDGAVEGSIHWWSRGHRAHHCYTDTDLDPYSAHKGLLWSHVGWMIVKPPRKPGIADVSDLTRNEVVRWQHRWYLPLIFGMGFILPTFVAGLSWGDWRGGFFYAGAARLLFVHHSAFCVNSLAHWLGDAPFNDKHTPRDHIITAFVTIGEGYHNLWSITPCQYYHAYLFNLKNNMIDLS